MLTSTKNPLVKAIRKLHTAKGRREEQLLLLEGTHLLAEACAVNYPLVTFCCTEDWQERHPQLWQQATSSCQRVEQVSPAVLKAMATTVQPDGVVVTAKSSSYLPPHIPCSLGLVLETLQDPGNLGTIIRTATAAGVDGLWLSSDSVDLENPKVLRASVGQWFRLPMSANANLSQVIRQCQLQGVQVVATLPKAKFSYWEIDWRCPSLILLGNEATGLSPELTVLAEQSVQIPLGQDVESLNVAIAAALIMYEALRQRLGVSR